MAEQQQKQQLGGDQSMTSLEDSVHSPREDNKNDSPGKGCTIEERLARLAIKKAKRQVKTVAKPEAIRREQDATVLAGAANAKQIYKAKCLEKRGVIMRGPRYTAIKARRKEDAVRLPKTAVEASDERTTAKTMSSQNDGSSGADLPRQHLSAISHCGDYGASSNNSPGLTPQRELNQTRFAPATEQQSLNKRLVDTLLESHRTTMNLVQRAIEDRAEMRALREENQRLRAAMEPPREATSIAPWSQNPARHSQTSLPQNRARQAPRYSHGTSRF